MATTTFSHSGTGHASPSALTAVGAFLAAWFRATPAYLMYRALVG